MNRSLTSAPAIHERQGGAFSYVSASRLNLWLKCPLAFRLRYLDGLKTPPHPAIFLGKMTHEVLAVFNRHLQLGVRLSSGDLARRLEQSWAAALEAEGLTFASAYEERSLRQQVADLVSAYLARFAGDENPLAVETALETPLIDPTSGEDLGLPLVGVIDLVLDQPGGPVIIDFKTSARAAEPLEITHEIQLSCYAYLYGSGCWWNVCTSFPFFHRWKGRRDPSPNSGVVASPSLAISGSRTGARLRPTKCGTRFQGFSLQAGNP